mmetsp:Transcript_38381/g.71988  ORF Transcript_38381/g.71988 Transcript_38381/m.71988 type:complete len:156 (-) Transcript_38381:136-603(-)
MARLSTTNRAATRCNSRVVMVRAGEIEEVTKDTFYPFCEATDKLVVLDCYTQWCGPCKLIYPQLVKMQDKYTDGLVFAKLDCNKENKELATSLGVKVVPTFFLFKGKEQLGVITGAKPDVIETAIVEQLEEKWSSLGYSVAALTSEREASQKARL